MQNLKRVLTALLLIAAADGAAAQWVDIELVSVGNVGNTGFEAGDDSIAPQRICGAVDYVYGIGKFEITAGQYTEFLNAVAAWDTYNLYNLTMSSYDLGGCQIQRTGDQGSYTYSVPPDWADRPVNFVSWGDAARFCNWLHNGRPTGSEDLTTTEDGSYLLNGVMSPEGLLAVTRKPDATWVIPTEDEWTKAAYHKNDGATGNYWQYPFMNGAYPNGRLPQPDPGNNATVSYWDEEYFAFMGPPIGPYAHSVVGQHVNSLSPYGTFDQAGNVEEWTDTVEPDASWYDGVCRILRGGDIYSGEDPWWIDPLYGPRSTVRIPEGPTGQWANLGFRVAYLPSDACSLPGDVDGSNGVDGNDIPGFVRVKLGDANPGDLASCADYGTGTLDGDVAAFVADLLGE